MMWGTVPDFRREGGPKRQTKGVRNRPPALFFRHFYFWWSLDFLAAGVSQVFFATDERNNTGGHFVSLAMFGCKLQCPSMSKFMETTDCAGGNPLNHPIDAWELATAL